MVEPLQQIIAAGAVQNADEHYGPYDLPSSPPDGESIQPIDVKEVEKLKAELAEAKAEIRKLKEKQVASQPPPSKRVRISLKSKSTTASVSRFEHMGLPQAMEKVMKRGSDILHKGDHCPRRTFVPECTAPDGYHQFSKKGSNQYAKKYTCTNCCFSCSEK